MNTSETGGNPPFSINIHKFKDALRAASPMKLTGKVTQIIGLVIESQGPTVTVGELCYVSSHFAGMPPVPAEVVGFREGSVLLMPVGEMQGIGPGCEVVATGRQLRVKVGMELLGRVLDGLGNPIDGKGPILAKEEYPLQAPPPPPLTRPRIHDNLYVGVRAIDGLITMGDGQRIGIMAGSGVGKSTLLSMIARNTEADISVITLVGERGREVRDFIERDLGEEGLKILRDVADKTGLRVVTEVVDKDDIGLVSEYADLLQVGARNMQNFQMLKALGKTQKPVLFKRGLSATISEWLNAAEYIAAGGNENIIFCERGIRTYETYTRNTMDLNAIAALKELTHFPVIADPSHGTGRWQMVRPLARASVAVGADGLIVEVHCRPEQALSDGDQSLIPRNFEILMDEVRQIAPAVGRRA